MLGGWLFLFFFEGWNLVYLIFIYLFFLHGVKFFCGQQMNHAPIWPVWGQLPAIFGYLFSCYYYYFISISSMHSIPICNTMYSFIRCLNSWSLRFSRPLLGFSLLFLINEYSWFSQLSRLFGHLVLSYLSYLNVFCLGCRFVSSEIHIEFYLWVVGDIC